MYYNKTDLIEGIKARDGDVFEFIDRRYKPSIVYLIYEFGGTSSDADDIYQDGVLRLIEIVDKNDFKLTAELSTLLYSICNNLWKLSLEKNRIANNYHVRKIHDDISKDIIDKMDQELYDEIFLESFNKLQKDCRLILKALMKGIPLKDVAATLDYSYDYLRRKKKVCHDYLFNLIVKHHNYKLIKKKEGIVRLY